MNRSEFMSELKVQLKRLSPEERSNLIAYYEEYFDEAGPEGEAALIAELGSPEEVVKRVLAESPEYTFRRNKPLTAWNIVWIVLASPIAIPLLLAVAAVWFSLVLVVWALLLTALILLFVPAIVGVALVAGGAYALLIGLAVLAQHLPTTIYSLGFGLFSIGLGGLILYFYSRHFRRLLRLVVQGFVGTARIAIHPIARRKHA